MFYFNDVMELSDFESFEVLHTSRSGWSVIGKLTVSQRVHQLPVADFSCEMSANLFVRMCRQLASDSVLQTEVRRAISASIDQMTIKA